MVSSAMIKTLPRSRMKESVFILLSGDCVSQKDVAVNLRGFDVLYLGVASARHVIHIANCCWVGRSRIYYVPVAVHTHSAIGRGSVAPPGSRPRVSQEDWKKHYV